MIRGRKILPPRPHFDLGRWGWPVNIVSVGWAILTIVMYISPLYVPVTSETIDYMNWSVLIIGATIIFSGLWWVVKARKTYRIYLEDDRSSTDSGREAGSVVVEKS